MGSGPALFVNKPFLFNYKDKYIRKTKRKDLIQGRKINAINDADEFEKVYHEMFPPELKLKREKDHTSRHPFYIWT